MRNSRTERFIKMKKWNANRRGIAFVLMLAMVFSIPMWSLAEAPTVMAGTTNFIDLKTDVPKAGSPSNDSFKELTLTAKPATNPATKKEAIFCIDMKLADFYNVDDDSHGKFYNPYDTFLTNGGTVEEDFSTSATCSSYEEYLNAQNDTDLPPTSFSCTFGGVTLGGVTTGDLVVPNLGGSQDKKIGTWSLTGESTDKVKVTVTLDKFLYSYNITEVKARFDISLTSGKADVGDGDVTINYDTTLDEIIVTWPAEKPPEPTEKFEYNIDKKDLCNGKTDKTYIDYEIKATARVTRGGKTEATTMNAMSIVDTVMGGKDFLILDDSNVSVSTDGGVTYTKLTTNDYTYTTSAGFKYQLPAYDETDPTSLITNASIKLRMKLTDAKYQDFINTGKLKETITNSASLLGSDDSELKKIAKDVSTNMESIFFSKGGKVIGLTDKFNWTLTGKTSLSGYTTIDAFIIDCIEGYDTDHMYITSGGVATTSEIGGNTINSTIHDTEIPCDTSYKDITVTEIKKLISDNSIQPGSWFYYTYGGEKTGITPTAVMIIPVSDYVDSNFEVKYQTQMVKQPAGDSKKNLENKARITWEGTWIGGSGSGPTPPTGDASLIDKEVVAEYDLMTKKANNGTYDLTKRELTWDFAVNKYGEKLDDVNIVDKLDDTKQRFIDEQIEVTKINRENGKSKGTITLNKWDGKSAPKPTDYYQITTVAGFTTLTVHFGSIATTDVYKFSIKTKVWDSSILAEQADGKNIKNKATITAKIGKNEVSQSAIDTRWSLRSVLIEKGLQKGYDYKEHSIEWKTTINPYQICIASKGGITSGAAMTDILPVGTYFGKVTGATRTVMNGDKQAGTVDADGNIHFAKYTTTGNMVVSKALDIWTTAGAVADVKWGTSERKTQLFNISESTSDKIEITYTTIFEDKYRKDNFKSNEPKGNVTVKNDCILDGKGGADEENQQDINSEKAHAKKEETLKVRPLAKSGQYYGGKDAGGGQEYTYADGTTQAGMIWIDWNLEVNRDQTSMAGVKVVDVLDNRFEMETTSFKMWKATPDSTTGKLTTTASVNVEDMISNGALQVYTTGFAFTIPDTDEYRSTPLEFSFNTFIVADATTDQMKNKVALLSGKTVTDDKESGSVVGAMDFNLSAYATATLSPYATVTKESDENRGLRLADAEFTLTPVVYQSGAVVSRNTALQKTKITGANGKATFRGLRTDTLYELKETKAPAGYKRTTELKYVIFDPINASYPIETKVATYDSVKKQTYWEITIFNITGTGEIPPGVVPTDSSISVLHFTKQTDDGQILPGVKFNITWTNKGATLSKDATSDANGKVLFSNLDAGKYAITEVANNNTAFKTIPNGTLKAEVKFDIINGYSFTITDGGLGVLAGDYSNYIVKNQYKRGTVKLDKLEKDTNIKLSDAEFEVMKGADRVAYLTEGTTTKGSYYLSNTDSENKNTVGDIKNSLGSKYLTNQNGEWKLLIGDYTIRETKVPSNYVEILENGQPNINASGAAVTSYAITIGEDTEKQITVENIYAGGKIIGHKYNDATTPAGLIGATIGLFVPSTTTFDAIHTYKGITTISTTGGAFAFKEIPFGEYLLVEITPPGGYYLNQTPVAVEVTRTAVGSTAVVTVTKNVGGEDIIITNAAIRSSGGGGGGSVVPPVVPPVEPPIIPPIKPPLVPPTPPIVPPTPPVNPPIIIPPPGQGEVVIPINPDGVTPGDTIFEVEGDDGIIADIVIGKDGNLQLPKLPPGTYTLKNMTTGDTVEFIIEDEQVPLASMDPDGLLDSINALKTPRTGVDNTMEYILLALMLFSIMGLSVVVYKIKKESK